MYKSDDARLGKLGLGLDLDLLLYMLYTLNYSIFPLLTASSPV